MTEKKITFLSAVGELHPNKQFLMSMPHNGKLTESEYNSCYMEITGTTEDETIITSDDKSKFTVKYAEALAKYEEQLKEILHVAGTKLFGEVVKTRKVDSLKLSSTGVMVANQTANNIYQS